MQSSIVNPLNIGICILYFQGEIGLYQYEYGCDRIGVGIPSGCLPDTMKLYNKVKNRTKTDKRVLT